MALAIAVCVGGFTWLYVQLDPWVRDFAGAEPAPTATPRDSASNSDRRATRTPKPDDEEASDEDEEQPAEEDPTETPEPDDEEEDDSQIQPVEEDDSDFDPDYQIVALEAVRLRSGPGVSFDIVIDGMEPGTPLEYLGDREPSQNPEADGDTEWLHFRVESGEEGWVRQIDVSEI